MLREVTAVCRMRHGVITRLCNRSAWGEVPVGEAIQQIESGRYRYWACQSGEPVLLHVGQGPRGKQLVSRPHRYGGYVLDELPECTTRIGRVTLEKRRTKF